MNESLERCGVSFDPQAKLTKTVRRRTLPVPIWFYFPATTQSVGESPLCSATGLNKRRSSSLVISLITPGSFVEECDQGLMETF
jgi:hypothetical protein